ncbi:MAG: flagellar biosynthesis anti-sigma factor FlgM [Sphingobium sp.]
MIKPVGQNIGAAIEASRLREGGKVRASAPLGSAISATGVTDTASPAARLAAEGAPVDVDRIAAIKAAIASGNYPVDASVIADRMLALDLPVGR